MEPYIHRELFELPLFSELPPIRFQHVTGWYPAGNAGVERYDCCKLSVILTDGLAAVMQDGVSSNNRGDVVVFRPEEFHYGRFLRSGPYEYLTILIPLEVFRQFGESGQALTHVFSDTTPGRENRISPPYQQRTEVLRLAQSMVELQQSEDPAKQMRLFACLIELLSLCSQVYREQKRQPAASAVPGVVSDTLQYINRHYPEIGGLSEIAARMGCSITYLTRTFRQHTGKTVYGYLTECRLYSAKCLLDAGASVTEACYRTGFGDCSNFIKAFRKAEGTTPLQYQKRARLGQQESSRIPE